MVAGTATLKERRRADHGGREPESAGQFVGGAPEQKSSNVAAGVGIVFDRPGIDGGLAAVGQPEVTLCEPAEEPRRLADLIGEVASAADGKRAAGSSCPQSWLDIPNGEPPDQAGVAWVGDSSEVRDHPPFESTDLFVGRG
ncbi:hypothetical protein [Nocardia aurantiaca]|uniref:Uncharacterized protein n=1 Tax=Nocardia aurantiaca TaxID=2675850 RepID=A0A6I3LAR4_9NOCA|nr:hypothetical protein [Nocardia aurantiaca]MTE16939.1 hypothetical protein [Nocardia aurantiaca]